ncbi:MAG TPA: phosphatase PAP2 family protein [Solirubrobacteraceae bacterium]|nr:phosphatase PAP2 family protein [Solirubrobacteraceae bacterium]
MRELRLGPSRTPTPVPLRAVRRIAIAAVVAGVAVPLVRRRLGIPPAVAIAGAALAPAAFCLAVPRSRKRDIATCTLQMWAYVAAYKMPHGSDPEGLERRVKVDYPIVVDRALGLGELPTVRLQRRLAVPGGFRGYEKALCFTHWVWFAVPHVALTFILFRHPERFPRAAVLTYGVFDIGALCYWVIPTAPPWYASERGRLGEPADGSDGPIVRRMMVEYGEEFWRDAWGPLYSVLGGNPFAAMPSLHFATSVMAATLLAETGPQAGALGTAYAAGIGVALVYLGEHYVADLLAGLGLTLAVRSLDRPFVRAPIASVGRRIGQLGERARARPPGVG